MLLFHFYLAHSKPALNVVEFFFSFHMFIICWLVKCNAIAKLPFSSQSEAAKHTLECWLNIWMVASVKMNKIDNTEIFTQPHIKKHPSNGLNSTTNSPQCDHVWVAKACEWGFIYIYCIFTQGLASVALCSQKLLHYVECSFCSPCVHRRFGQEWIYEIV